MGSEIPVEDILAEPEEVGFFEKFNTFLYSTGNYICSTSRQNIYLTILNLIV